ncbi:hypothetical protein HNQ77_004862 [Silvibacterium bohemicum]|uniref:DUF6798 domain-containing protein n=1 Tax=Silvibacterium bohemicum TaxID=1577686 RepID=A0A841K6W7_9BACT|nr:DUF6798 domain-containing protein [Silvibacterium bohemicum]MBB6146881.1 hypothetical protein [Silvibacterium bohemicum]
MTTPDLVAHRPLSSTRTIVISQSALLWIAVLTPIALFVHGYHPFADDAGIYVSGIRKLADPGLYRPDAPFVLAHTHLSLFAHVAALTLRITRLPLEFILFATHLASIFLYLLACWTLAERVFPLLTQRWCAVALAAACFTLPVAGTSLALMDPYVTARSFSTPIALLALASAIDRRWSRCVVLLLAGAILHPLMTAYAAAFILLFFLVDFGIPRAAFLVCMHAVTAAALVYFLTRHLPEMPAYREAVLSRRYLIPGRWTAMEDLGLGMPMILFALAVSRQKTNPLLRKLSLCACLLGISATLIAFVFIHPAGSLVLARLEPLRAFHMIYAVGAILLGGLLGSVFFSSHHGLRARGMALALLSVVAAVSYLAQRGAYPASAHVELPGSYPKNPWQQAFLWIRANTPSDAVFAANPDLVFITGEDAQGFRATAERSLLADDKDEGVVVVFPYLAGVWAKQRDPQEGIDTMTDAERIARLRPAGADWVLLARSAETSMPCPYRNSVAQVCRLQ